MTLLRNGLEDQKWSQTVCSGMKREKDVCSIQKKKDTALAFFALHINT